MLILRGDELPHRELMEQAILAALNEVIGKGRAWLKVSSLLVVPGQRKVELLLNLRGRDYWFPITKRVFERFKTLARGESRGRALRYLQSYIRRHRQYDGIWRGATRSNRYYWDNKVAHGAARRGRGLSGGKAMRRDFTPKSRKLAWQGEKKRESQSEGLSTQQKQWLRRLQHQPMNGEELGRGVVGTSEWGDLVKSAKVQWQDGKWRVSYAGRSALKGEAELVQPHTAATLIAPKVGLSVEQVFAATRLLQSGAGLSKVASELGISHHHAQQVQELMAHYGTVLKRHDSLTAPQAVALVQEGKLTAKEAALVLEASQ